MSNAFSSSLPTSVKQVIFEFYLILYIELKEYLNPCPDSVLALKGSVSIKLITYRNTDKWLSYRSRLKSDNIKNFILYVLKFFWLKVSLMVFVFRIIQSLIIVVGYACAKSANIRSVSNACKVIMTPWFFRTFSRYPELSEFHRIYNIPFGRSRFVEPSSGSCVIHCNNRYLYCFSSITSD